MITAAKNILLVEDNHGDAKLTSAIIAENIKYLQLKIVPDGEEAIRYLLKQDPFIDVATPDLILLDINLPKINGFEVLSFIKGRDDLKHIPVIMLTTSNSSDDVMKAYKSYANCYIVKPLKLENFIEVIKQLEHFWLNIATLPVHY